MTYEQICEQNRYLFGKLENLAWIKLMHFEMGNDHLYKKVVAQYLYVKSMIDDNLDLMETMWGAVNSERIIIHNPIFSAQDRKVLALYLKSGVRPEEIAQSTGMRLERVQITIMKYVEHRMRLKRAGHANKQKTDCSKNLPV